MKQLRLIAILLGCLGLHGCITAPKENAHPEMIQYPTLETIDLEGYVIYYRDLSDPCDPGSTAWNNLRAKKRKGQIPLDCSEPVALIVPPAPVVSVPETDFVLLFAMRGKTLANDQNNAVVNELASMSDWPIRYHVYGAAGGVGPTLEKLGMKRANVVKEGLVAAGVAASKIEIMPYDPSIPGLRAVVRLIGEGA